MVPAAQLEDPRRQFLDALDLAAEAVLDRVAGTPTIFIQGRNAAMPV